MLSAIKAEVDGWAQRGWCKIENFIDYIREGRLAQWRNGAGGADKLIAQQRGQQQPRKL